MTFDKENLPSDPETWVSYYKKQPTRAIRITGPFAVQTREGTMTCEDGWLAVDSNGDPYPIASDVFRDMYGGQ